MMRADAGIARLSELVCIAAGIKNESDKPFTAAELMPWMEREEQYATAEDMKRMFGIKD